MKKLILTLSFVGAASMASAATTGFLACGSAQTSATELNATFACPKFNLGGSLTEIDLQATGSITGTITLVNNNAATISASATTVSNFAVTNGGSLPGFSFLSPLLTATISSGTQTIGSGSTFTSPLQTSSGNSPQTTVNTNAASFANYIGAGTFNVSVLTSTNTTGNGGGGNLLVGGTTNATAALAVQYQYNAATVPEPGTTVLGATGLIGLLLFARRQAKA